MDNLPEDGVQVRAMTYGNEDEEIASEQVVGKLTKRQVKWTSGSHVQCFVNGQQVDPKTVKPA